MKKQIMKPFRAPRSTVEMRQATVYRKDNSARFKEMEKWMDKNVTGEGAKTSPVQKRKTVETCDKAASDSEEPTEFGVVWERFVIKETQDVLGLPSTGGLEITTRNEDCVGIRSITAESPSAVTQCTTEEESPILSEYESDGFLSRRKTLSKRSKAKIGIFQRAKNPNREKRSMEVMQMTMMSPWLP
jgi:hypothetical protein